MVFYLAKVQNIIETTNYYCLFLVQWIKSGKKICTNEKKLVPLPTKSENYN